MRFFFYGNLIAGSGNAVAADMAAKLHDLGAATVRGALHAIEDAGGWYPALLPGAEEVRGRLYQAGPAFAACDLAALDRYEDFDPAAPAASLYRRETWQVRSGGGQVEAQTYRFSRPLPEAARPIADGDFHAWLAREGLRAFGVSD